MSNMIFSTKGIKTQKRRAKIPMPPSTKKVVSAIDIPGNLSFYDFMNIYFNNV